MDVLTPVSAWASIGGFCVSVVGLAVTIHVATRVRRIESRYVRQALIPRHIKILDGRVRNLDRNVRAKNAEQARENVSMCHAVLEELEPYTTDVRKRRLQTALAAVQELRDAALADMVFLTRCKGLVHQLKALILVLEALQEEAHWRRENGD